MRFACDALIDGGFFVVKILQGADEPALFSCMRKSYGKDKRYKQAASRSESKQIYNIGTQFKGR